MDKNRYVLVRTYSMGVFAGDLVTSESDNDKIVLKNARRIWYWSGASSLSELAMLGTSDPKNCKFPCEVNRIELISKQGFEILDVTNEAKKSIESVKIWTQH